RSRGERRRGDPAFPDQASQRASENVAAGAHRGEAPQARRNHRGDGGQSRRAVIAEPARQASGAVDAAARTAVPPLPRPVTEALLSRVALEKGTLAPAADRHVRHQCGARLRVFLAIAFLEMLSGLLWAHTLPRARRAGRQRAGKCGHLGRLKAKGANSEESAPLIGYTSATGGNMQTAPYQFAETQRDG